MLSWASKRVSGLNPISIVRGNMSFYAHYIRERTNDLILETPEGFATYRYLNDATVYIIDIFVLSDFREKGVAAKMADEIVKEAKARGCTELVGTVVPSMKNSTISMKVLLGYGMKLRSAGPDLIVFGKEI